MNESIFLRRPEINDVMLLMDWENDTSNWKVSGTLKPYTKKEISDFITSNHTLYNNGQERFIICLNGTESPVGCIDLFDFEKEKKIVGVGVLIADLNKRNRGYAKQALVELIEYCKKEVGIERVFCHIHKSNYESIRLFEGGGFQFCKELVMSQTIVNYYELILK